MANCQNYRSFAQNSDAVGRIPAPWQVLVPGGRSGAEVRSQAKACLPLFAFSTQLRDHTMAPISSTLSVQLESWSGRCGKIKPAKILMSPYPNKMRRQEKINKKVLWAWLYFLCTPYYALADRFLVTPTPAAVQLLARTRHPSRQLNPGGGDKWTATLATSQAGIKALAHWPGLQLPIWVYESFIRWVKSLSPTVFRTITITKFTNPNFSKRHHQFEHHGMEKGSI